MFTLTTRALLNLTRDEERIFLATQREPLNISDLARKTKIPRTTLYTALASLKNRGFIESRRKGKAVFIVALPYNEIQKLLTGAATSLTQSGTLPIIKKHEDGKTSGFTLVYGKEAMLKIWESFASKDMKRMYAIQPTLSLVNTVKLFKPGEFVPINQKIKKNKIIMEAIMKEDGFPTYMKLYANQPAVQKAIIKSFIGRAADTVLVDNQFLNSNAELIMTPHFACLMNWEKEVGIKIENKDMVDFLLELFKLAKGYGKKFDFNLYMKRWLEKVDTAT